MNVFHPEIQYLDPSLKYLVIDSKYGLHPWRFSIETFLKLYNNNYKVYYLSLITFDPSLFLGKMRIFFRRAKYKNERHSFAKKLIDKDRNIALKFWNFEIFQILDYFKLISNLGSNPRLKIGIDSWLAIKYGDTQYRKTLMTVFQSLRVGRSYLKTIKFLDLIELKDNYDVVLTFNGRFPIDSAVSDYCINNKIKIILFDGGSISDDNYNRIQYFQTSPHDNNEIIKKIDHYWNFGSSDKFLEAKKSINSMIEGERFVANSFNWENQIETIDSIVDFNIADLNKSLIFFASSDWEQGAISYWKPNYGFTNQFDMLLSLSKICHQLSIKIMVKPHPIRKNVSKKSDLNEYNLWVNFCQNNKIDAKVIPNNIGLKTKLLLDEGAIIAGFGTSVLAQSIYLGKPTIVGSSKLPWCNEQNNSCLANTDEKILLVLDGLTQQNLSVEQKLSLKESVLPWAYYRTICGVEMSETNFTKGKIFVGEIQLDEPKI